ncbi:MAG TPA: PRTRC system protein C [Gallionella sp.]|jgi:PRTRC genetic system protein C|nr:PRTRC system protein C [Gallionella sp.]MDP1940437.1 PRTRC system protein C [Gallionella sp.]OGS68679.1 MAG: carbamoylphosphate synthase large subunit [Gallionellales bacterium GWA2_54_124]HCI53299.1 PRTRC system protein C [Gallionella sp.]
MAIQTTTLTRSFSYGGMTLPDPGKSLSLEEVRDVYAAAYPELVSASIEGPEKRGDNLIYTFKKGVGTKG